MPAPICAMLSGTSRLRYLASFGLNLAECEDSYVTCSHSVTTRPRCTKRTSAVHSADASRNPCSLLRYDMSRLHTVINA